MEVPLDPRWGLPDVRLAERRIFQRRNQRGEIFGDGRAQEHVGNSLRAIGLGSLTASWRKRRDWAMANPFLKLVAIGNYGRSDLEDRFA